MRYKTCVLSGVILQINVSLCTLYLKKKKYFSFCTLPSIGGNYRYYEHSVQQTFKKTAFKKNVHIKIVDQDGLP